MLKSTEELGENESSRHETSENNEYVRLVIANEASPLELEILRPQEKSENTFSLKWWIKVSLWSIISIIFLLAFFKWGVPFLFEKVVPLNYINSFFCFYPIFQLNCSCFNLSLLLIFRFPPLCS